DCKRHLFLPCETEESIVAQILADGADGGKTLLEPAEPKCDLAGKLREKWRRYKHAGARSALRCPPPRYRWPVRLRASPQVFRYFFFLLRRGPPRISILAITSSCNTRIWRRVSSSPLSILTISSSCNLRISRRVSSSPLSILTISSSRN